MSYHNVSYHNVSCHIITYTCSQIEVHVFTDWGSRIHGMRFTCSQIEVHVLTDWGSRIYILMFTYSLIEFHVFTDWGSGFRSNYKWFVYSQIEVLVFTDWSSCIHWLRFVYSLIIIVVRIFTDWGSCRRWLRAVSSQFEDGVVSDWGRCRHRLRRYAYPPGSRTRIEDGQEGSRRVEEGLWINACAWDYCNRALCAFLFVRVPVSMLLYTRRHSSTSSTHTAHRLNRRRRGRRKANSRGRPKISSTESRFFSLTNVFSMDFAHGHCAFDKHIRLSGHTEMILWCLI